MAGFAYLNAQVPLAFAHRGGAAAADENTAEAFGRAVALGFRYVETDVHATADGVPVVFHDDSLRRLTGETGRIATRRWADLATVRVGGAAAIPRLDEVLAGWPAIRFNIDVKADPAIGRGRAIGRLPVSAVAAQVPVRHGLIHIVDRRFVAHAHRLGLQVHVWTIDDPAEMHRLLDLGLDGIMTDDLEALRTVYLDRGHWPPLAE